MPELFIGHAHQSTGLILIEHTDGNHYTQERALAGDERNEGLVGFARHGQLDSMKFEPIPISQLRQPYQPRQLKTRICWRCESAMSHCRKISLPGALTEGFIPTGKVDTPTRMKFDRIAANLRTESTAWQQGLKPLRFSQRSRLLACNAVPRLASGLVRHS